MTNQETLNQIITLMQAAVLAEDEKLFISAMNQAADLIDKASEEKDILTLSQLEALADKLKSILGE